MGKTILGALGVFAVLIVVFALYKPRTSTREAGPSTAFTKFRDAKFSDAARLTIQKGKGSVELKKAGDKWVVASAFGYPADSERVDKILKCMTGMDAGEVSGKSEFGEFEVDAKKGGTLTAYAADGNELGKIIVGKNAAGGSISTTRVYVRFEDEPTVYAVESSIRSEASLYGKDAEAKGFLQKKIFSLGEDLEVETVRLTRPEKPDVLVERKMREVPVEKPKDAPATSAETKDGEPPAAAKDGDKPAEEKKPETKKEEYFVVTSGSDTKDVGKTEEYSARGLLNRGKELSIDDAVEPKDRKEYGLETPQLKAQVSYRKKDAPDSELKTVTFLFGNAMKDEKGENKGYYVIVDDEANKDRIYLVQSWTFDSWNKEMKDFLPKPKEEPKPSETPPGTPPPAVEAKPGDAKPPEPAPGASAKPAEGAAPNSTAPAGTAPAPAPEKSAAGSPPPSPAPAPAATPAPAGAPDPTKAKDPAAK